MEHTLLTSDGSVHDGEAEENSLFRGKVSIPRNTLLSEEYSLYSEEYSLF
jgi:hypothetical protein